MLKPFHRNANTSLGQKVSVMSNVSRMRSQSGTEAMKLPLGTQDDCFPFLKWIFCFSYTSRLDISVEKNTLWIAKGCVP